VNKELCGNINRAVERGNTLSAIPASDWAQFTEWAQWMKGPFDRPPGPAQLRVLKHHVLKIEVECALRGVTF